VGEGIPVLGAFIMLVGLLIGILGLIADQISQLRLVGLTSAPLRDRD
jgi:hypothetical protein